jgi:MraZ protein
MFRGASQVSIDTKFRLAVPTRHRDALLADSTGLMLAAHPHGCLMLYPRQVWLPIEAKLNSLSSFDETAGKLQRLIVGQAEPLEIDSAGRLQLPPVLRAYAKLEKEIMFVGQGSRFELWNLAGWNAQIESLVSGSFVMPAELQGFSL